VFFHTYAAYFAKKNEPLNVGAGRNGIMPGYKRVFYFAHNGTAGGIDNTLDYPFFP